MTAAARSPPSGAFDGVYRLVALYALPAWLEQGWTVAFVNPPYSACVCAPLPRLASPSAPPGFEGFEGCSRVFENPLSPK